MTMHADRQTEEQMGGSLTHDARLMKQARLLISRLERLTPDSAWARRASGCRGTLIRLIGRVEAESEPSPTPIAEPKLNPQTTQDLQRLLNQGFTILHAAARESITKASQQ